LRARVGKAMDYQYADLDDDRNTGFVVRIEALYRDARALYEDMLAAGVAREHARMVLPVAQYTTFIWTVNALSLMNFLYLRNSPHAQAEIRVYAEAMETIFAERLPWTHAAFRAHWGSGMV
ncbi:MAG: FAD-dependent thymidylate synthase, partial [Anaerolineae bacterium]|nr:FAD-dependent thymidylate synthase [Anaerolineae bacterium]